MNNKPVVPLTNKFVSKDYPMVVTTTDGKEHTVNTGFQFWGLGSRYKAENIIEIETTKKCYVREL